MAGKKLCGLPSDKWSYLLDEVGHHVDLQHIADQVGFPTNWTDLAHSVDCFYGSSFSFTISAF